MEWKLKKMWPAAAASLVAFTSVINAADEMQMRNLENRVTSLEQRKGSNGMINPPANPKVKEGADVIITGEVTYWKAHQNGMEYAFENFSTVTAPPLTGKTERPRHKYDWGFKVGLGYVLPHDGWDVYANYTRFNGHKHNCHSCGDTCNCSCAPRTFYPTYLIPCTTGTGTAAADGSCFTVTEACGKWKVRLNRLDVELGREFFVSKWLTLRPFMGLAGVIITQHNDIDYAGGTYVAAGHVIEHKMRNQFRGGGVRGGLNSQWDFAKDWSVYGNLALNLLYGKFNVKQSATDETLSTGSLSTLYKINNPTIVGRPVADLGIGVQWEHAFADDSFFMSFNVGWEQHYYWGQNQFMRFAQGSTPSAYVENQGDLSLAGWVFGARFDF